LGNLSFLISPKTSALLKVDNSQNRVSLNALASLYSEAELQPGPRKEHLYRAGLQMIEQGFWNPGDRLPTDLEIVEALPLSLGTIQLVFRRLKEEGLITRNKRGGSYLADAHNIRRDYRFFAFLDDDGESLIPVSNHEFIIDSCDTPGPWQDFLGRDVKLLEISRIVSVRDEFRLYSKFYLAEDPFGSLRQMSKSELQNASLKNLLRLRFGHPTLKTQWQLQNCSVTDETAKKLQCNAGAAANQFDVLGFSHQKKPLFYHRYLSPMHSRVMKIDNQ